MKHPFDPSFDNPFESLLSTKRLFRDACPSISDMIGSNLLSSQSHISHVQESIDRIQCPRLDIDHLTSAQSITQEYAAHALTAQYSAEHLLSQVTDFSEIAAQAERNHNNRLNRLIHFNAADAYNDIQAHQAQTHANLVLSALHGPIDLHRLLPNNDLADLLDNAAGLVDPLDSHRSWMESLEESLQVSRTGQALWKQLTATGQLSQSIRDFVDAPREILQAGIDELQKLTKRSFHDWEHLTRTLDLILEVDALPETLPGKPNTQPVDWKLLLPQNKILRLLVVLWMLGETINHTSGLLQLVFGDNILDRVVEHFQATPAYYVLNKPSPLCPEPWQCAATDVITDLPAGTPLRGRKQKNGYVFVEAKVGPALGRGGWVRLEHTDPVDADVQTEFKTEHFAHVPDDDN